jgi:hypothetical protein
MSPLTVASAPATQTRPAPVRFTLDGRVVEAEPGESILPCAARHGVDQCRSPPAA